MYQQNQICWFVRKILNNISNELPYFVFFMTPLSYHVLQQAQNKVTYIQLHLGNNVKAAPLQTWSGPEGSR
jgi:hypothetical protein